jgi:hypothetical protein
MLTGAGALVAAGAIGALARPGVAAANVGLQGLAGLWHTEVSALDNSFPAFQAFELYGSALPGPGLWFGSGQPDLTPAALSSTAWGIWEPVGLQRFRVTGRFWVYDPNANPTGFSAVTFTVDVSAGGNTYKGTGTIEFFDNNGVSLGPPSPIADNGARITFS